MKSKILESLVLRVASEITPQSSIKFLKTLNLEDCIDIAVNITFLYSRTGAKNSGKTASLIEVISAIGHTVRNYGKLKKDSGAAAKAGAFLLYSLESAGLIKVVLGKGAGPHNTYLIEVTNDEELLKLWATIPVEKTEKLPSFTPYAPWTSSRHETGMSLVKTSDKNVLRELTPETHPIVFACVNRAQEVGWKVNEAVLSVYLWALRNKAEAFSEIWEMQSPEAKRSKYREAIAIGSIAERMGDKPFYHLYTLDFRGRKYPSTAYLHEQGSDLAKGLLLRADTKPAGEQGFYWLLISLASNWAGTSGRPDGLKTDKLPMQERINWALDNEDILLSYAKAPKVNQGWMSADKPWQFLAACIELYRFRYWQAVQRKLNPNTEPSYDYPSNLECFIDGSNNGSQHLAALTHDDVTAPHVNLVPSELPGDLYKYVADHVWESIEREKSRLTVDEIEACERFIDNLIDLKKQISGATPKSDRRMELISKINNFKREHADLMDKSCCVFWSRITDSKHRRKVVKRNVMTIPYGGTAYGLGQQQIDDARKHGIELLLFMEHKWGAYMGRAVHEDCKISLKRPMQLLSVFEAAGRAAEAEDAFLKWRVPITDFPVVQHYTEGTVKKVWVQYGPPDGPKLSTGWYANSLQVAVCFIEIQKPSKKKQSQGASPNAIHSLDAAHLMLTVWKADFPVTTVHDSFGCLLADMPALYRLVRDTFVELYESNPLSKIMKDINGDLTYVEFGDLDINWITQSEYAFA